MSKTCDQIRRENGIKWREIYAALRGTVTAGKVHGRNAHARAVDSAFKGMKREIGRAAKRQGPMSCWLVEVILCEAMSRVANLQTDIEDFCGSPQRPEVHPQGSV